MVIDFMEEFGEKGDKGIIYNDHYVVRVKFFFMDSAKRLFTDLYRGVRQEILITVFTTATIKVDFFLLGIQHFTPE